MTTPDAIARVEEAVGFLEYMREEDLADAVSETARELKEARAALTVAREDLDIARQRFERLGRMEKIDQDDEWRLREGCRDGGRHATAALARIDEVMP